jgi:ArsR family transcriptional regulator, arsenate/arsenite/antimonite-responsive transcriptional repressor
MAHMRYAAYQGDMESPVALLSALAEPTRLAALRILWDGGEHCVCELMTKLGASQSRMSRHMSALKAVGLVTDRRDAQWVRYRLNASLPAQARAIVVAIMASVPEPQRRAA